jgi:hypothetical protein
MGVADVARTARNATSSSVNRFHFKSVTINSGDIFKVHFVNNVDMVGPNSN